MRFILPFLFFLTSTVAFAQTQADWIQNNGAYTTDRGTAVKTDHHGNLFVTGIFTDTLYINGQTHYGNGFIDSYVAKLDSNGTYIWIQLINGPKDDQAERISVLPDGDVVVTGTFADSVRIGSMKTHAQGNDDVFLARLNGTDGATQWIISAGSYYSYERVGGLTSNSTNIFWGINFGSDLIIDNDTVTAVGFNDALVATLDFNGNIQSHQTLSGSGNDNITAMTCDDNGNVYTGGRFNGTFNGDTAFAGFDLFYGKLQNGLVAWMKTYGGWGSESVTAITRDAQSIYIAGWYIDTLPLGDTLLYPDAVWSDQVFITSIDANGNPNWFFVGFPDSGADFISDITVACNGDLLFTGLTTYFANESPEAPEHMSQPAVRCQFGDTYIARMSDAGELLWIKNTLGTNLNSGLGIAADSAGHIYVTGYFTDSLYLANASIKGNGGNDNFLFRINDPYIKCATEDTTIVTGLSNSHLKQTFLFPNPSTGNSFLIMNNELNTVRVTLSDVHGKSISDAAVAATNAPRSLFSLFGKIAAGVYLVTIESDASRQTLRWVVTP